MANAADVFDARIVASDNVSGIIDAIKNRLHALGHEVEHVGHQTEHLEKPFIWHHMREHVDVMTERFHGMRLGIGEVGNSITELLPTLGAITAATAVAGLFETAEHTAEAYGQLAHTAKEINTTANTLNILHGVAKLTDTSVEGLDNSLNRLTRNLYDAGHGSNKGLAANLRLIHLNPNDYKSGADAILDLAEAFKNADGKLRERMAFDLFGKQGKDLIPLLSLGKEKLEELIEESTHLNIDLRPYGEGLDKYNEAQKKLNLAVGGFTTLLGGELAPVLQPLVDDATKWVVANRPWITGKVAQGVKDFSAVLEKVPAVLEKIPLGRIGHDLYWATSYAVEFADHVGGARVVIDLLAASMAFRGIYFLAGPIKETAKFMYSVGTLATKLGTELVNAWNGVGHAAAAAGKEELAALEVARGKTVASAATAGAAEGAAAVGAAESGIVERVRAKAAADIALANAQTALKLKARGIGLGVNTLIAAYNAQDGFDISKEDVREHPEDARFMTREQFMALPEHIAHPVPFLGITDDPEHPGWIERNFDFRADHAGWIQQRFGFGNRRDFMADERLPFAAMPLSPAMSQLPPQNGKVDVVIHIPNMPPSAVVETTQSGSVGSVRTNLGQAWMDDPANYQ